LYDEISNFTLFGVYDANYPTWAFFSDASYVKNTWMIHFTDDAWSIGQEGFKYGVSDHTRLGLTTHLDDFEKQYGGYAFAFVCDNTRLSRVKYEGYGNEAVMFRASGVEGWHHGDTQNQCMF
jgi:hypothetical protein